MRDNNNKGSPVKKHQLKGADNQLASFSNNQEAGVALRTFDNQVNKSSWIEFLGPFQLDLTPALINGTNPLNNGGGPLSTNANTSFTSHYNAGAASTKQKHQKN